MGACQANDTQTQGFESNYRNVEAQNIRRDRSNPFFEQDLGDTTNDKVLARYHFRSKYIDTFVGECSVLQEKGTQNLFLCKQLTFSSQQEMNQKLNQLKKRQQGLTSKNIILIREVFNKQTDGFFSNKHLIYIIIDYPFINFQRELFNRMNKQISFTKEEIMNFITSTIRGYADIERAGFKTEKIRLRNIFIGIYNKEAVIKVAETDMIASKSNYKAVLDSGPHENQNRDIYLSPEEYRAWCNDDENFQPNPKSGVFSLGMSIMDLCTMDSSRQAYFFTQKTIDKPQIQHRIQICGKKYGGNVEKVLSQMLEFDVDRRVGFSQLDNKIPAFRNEQSRMHLSTIPNQRSSYIHNDTSNLKSQKLFKSIVSDYNNSSRVFASRIKANRNVEELQTITEHYTNGNKYTGQKKGNIKHGQGQYQFKDGSRYNGEWADNKINGNGILYFPNGKTQYSGEWINDEFSGWGSLFTDEVTESWVRYDGEFKNGVREGRGKMVFKNGIVYDGEFRGGKISGRGRKINQTGEVIDKFWDTVSPNFFSQL